MMIAKVTVYILNLMKKGSYDKYNRYIDDGFELF
jgi:hypothetical protein